MQIDYKFLQKICDAMRDNESFCIDVNSLYKALYDTYDAKTADKLQGHLHILADEGDIEVLSYNPSGFNLESGMTIMRLTSKGYGQCSYIE